MPDDAISIAGNRLARENAFSREGLFRYSMAFFLGALTLLTAQLVSIYTVGRSPADKA